MATPNITMTLAKRTARLWWHSAIVRIGAAVLLVASVAVPLIMVMILAEDPPTLLDATTVAADVPFVATLIVAFWVGGIAIPEMLFSPPAAVMLMLPVSRAQYLRAQVISGSLSVVAFYGVSSAMAYVAVRVFTFGAFNEVEAILWPDTAARAGLRPFTLLSVVASLSLTSTIARSRKAHLVYWGLCQLLIIQFNSTVQGANPAARLLEWPIEELLQPMWIGPAGDFMDTAARGSWYIVRAISQGCFGLALAVTLATYLYERADMSVR